MNGLNYLIISDYEKMRGGAGIIASYEYGLFQRYTSARRIVAINDNEKLNGRVVIRILFLNIFILLNFLKNRNTKAIVHTLSFFPVIKLISLFWKDKITFVVHDYLLICPSKSLYNTNAEDRCSLSGYSRECLATNCGYSMTKKLINTFTLPDPSRQSVRVLSEASANILESSGRSFGNMYIMRNFDVSHDLTNFRVRTKYERVVLFCGRYAIDKGFDLFMELARKYQSSNLRFICCGGGEIVPSKYVEDLGWLIPGDVSALINQSDLVIYPSRQIDADPLIFQICLRFRTPMIVPYWNALSRDVEQVFGEEYIINNVNDIDIEKILASRKRHESVIGFEANFPSSIKQVYNIS